MSINYEFPYITNINDVLPHIDDDFRVVAKDEFTFINYNMIGNCFPAIVGPSRYSGDSGYGAAVRRECRGLTFYTETGLIASRPYHKFFNYGERSDMEYEVEAGETVLEKLDGSMIRPLVFPNGEIRWGTKMGITDVAMYAEEYVAGKIQYYEMAEALERIGMNPIFEFCSPRSRVVVGHEKESMVLLDIRHKATGAYLDRTFVKDVAEENGIPVVDNVDHLCQPAKKVYEVKNIVDNTRAGTDGEGVVVILKDGHRVKIKTEDYVRLHRAKDMIRNERRVMELVFHEQIDDVYPLLTDYDRSRVSRVVSEVSDGVYDATVKVAEAYGRSKFRYDTKKAYAISGDDSDSWVRQHVFALWDDKVESGKISVINMFKNACGSEKSWEELKKKLGLKTSWLDAPVE